MVDKMNKNNNFAKFLPFFVILIAFALPGGWENKSNIGRLPHRSGRLECMNKDGAKLFEEDLSHLIKYSLTD